MSSTDKNIILQDTKCLTSDELLRYRDHRMSAEELHRAERHLVDCALCSEALEGAAFVTSPFVFEKVTDDVRHMTDGGSAIPHRRNWLAAASIAAVAVIAAYTYNEYKEVQHPAVALQKEPIELPSPQANEAFISQTPASVPAAVAAEAAEPIKETAKVISPVPVNRTPQEKIMVQDEPAPQAPAESETAEEIDSKSNYQPVESVQLSDERLSMQSYSTNQASYPKLEVASSKKRSKSGSASDLNKKSEAKDASGNLITYVHNLKVIDYRFEGVAPITDGSTTGSGTEPKFENKEKKATATSSTPEVVRKTTYLDLIAKPLALYKNGQFLSAIASFNEVLAIHPADHNAMFYKGLSLYRLERYQEAIASLSGPANVSGDAFNEEARFYMAKSYAAIGNTEIAKDLFNGLQAEDGFYSEKAGDELKKLR
jgi:tetratricopeptide (TPR) repeat protein